MGTEEHADDLMGLVRMSIGFTGTTEQRRAQLIEALVRIGAVQAKRIV